MTIAAMAPLADARFDPGSEFAGYDLPLASGLELEAALFGLVSCATSDKA